MEYPRVAVIAPAYNPAQRLLEVISGIAKYVPLTDILVVADGSSDRTALVAKDCGAIVPRHAKNLGKGAALKTGLAFALAQGYDAVLTIDADGQHDPRLIPAFLRAQRETAADILIGSRTHNRSPMPLDRRCSNALTSLVLSIRAGCRIPDSQSGFRLMRTWMLRHLPLENNGYQMESELLIRARTKKASTASIPTSTLYRGEQSSIQPLRDTLRFVALVLRSLFWT